MGAVAAALVVAAVISFVTLHPSQPLDGPPERVYTTGIAQRAIIELTDGSRVVLAPNTTLKLAAGFGERGRFVTLRGEAHFRVAHRHGQAFEVVAGKVTTRVVGTVFSVRKYDDDTSVTVAVSSGRVAVGSAFLHANDVAVASDPAAVRVTHNVDVESLSAWTEGRIVFKRATLATVIRELDRWYDLDIRLRDPALGATVLTLSFADLSADDALHVLTRTLGARYTRAGRIATIYREGATQ
jgi:transmembrane sensor